MSVRKRTWTTKGISRTRWVYDHTDPVTGKRAQAVIRDHLGKPVTTRAQAERIAAAQYAAQASVEPTVTLTLSELLALHAKRRDISTATATAESFQSRHLLRILGSDTPVSHIGLAMLEDYATTRQAEFIRPINPDRPPRKTPPTVSGATVRKEIALFAQAMRWAHRRDYIQIMPPPLPRIVTESTTPRILTRDEVTRLLHACGDDDASLRQIVEFTYLTGLRRAELFRLTWTEVDLQSKRILFTTQKRGNSHSKRKTTVYLADRACELLKRRKTAFPFETGVFSQPPYYANGKITAQLTTDIRSAARRASLPNPRKVGPHALRHACASHMLEAGATIPEVAAHLRHRDGGALLLRTYAHTHETALRNAANLLSSNATKTQRND